MAKYPGVIGVYLVSKFRGKAGGQWEPETWQVGVRLAVSGFAGPPGLADGNIELQSHTVADAFNSETTGDGVISYGWTGDDTPVEITQADQKAMIDQTVLWQNAIKGLLSNEYVWDSVRLYPFRQDGTSATAPTIFTPAGATYNPSGTAMLPPDVALGVSYRSVVRGPSGRGRIFMGGIPQASLGTNGLLTSAAINGHGNALKNYFQALRAINTVPGTSYRYAPVIWHRGTDTAAVIGTVRVDDELDTQRRRDRQRNSVWANFPLT